MKVSHPAHRFMLAATTACLALSLGACSGSQQDEENLEAESENEQANLGEDDAAEGNGQGNFNNNGGNQQLQNGADVNNATEEETANEANPTLDNSAGGAQEVADVPVETMPVQQAAPMQAAAEPMAPASAQPTAESPVAGGRVRYVRQDGIQILNAPNGQPVHSLNQGDHPVTWEENGWYRITNNMYVPVDAMSDTGVPRAQSARGWNP